VASRASGGEPRDPRLHVAQLGARRHYLVARTLDRLGRLGRLYTDLSAGAGWLRPLAWLPSGLRPAPLTRLLARRPEGIAPQQVTAFTRFGLEYARRVAGARTPTQRTRTYLWGGRRFGELVVRGWRPEAGGVYSFDAAALEILEHARRLGLYAVVDQTIPAEAQWRLHAEELRAFPGWEEAQPPDEAIPEFLARERAEWELADAIVCGSEFLKEQVAASGGPLEKCRVVPYAIEGAFQSEPRERHDGPLRVLTVGAVGLRKGSPYVLAAARRLGRAAQFRMVGRCELPAAVTEDLRRHVECVGAVPRPQVLRHYAWADVFLLPSLCEGSAMVCYEALACGLPVIATHNTGTIVRDGVEGYVVPLRDADAIAERIERLAGDRELLARLSAAARERCASVASPAAYAERLAQVLPGLRAR